MSSDLSVSIDELVENPTPRVPVCLCLDTSSSMAGAPIAELNEGVRMFGQAIRDDEVARYAAEIAVVTFGATVDTPLDFGPIDSQTMPTLQAWGGTPMGAGVNRAIDILEVRKDTYRSAGLDYYQPWLVLMSDGMPTDAIGAAETRIAALVEARKVSVFAIGIGASADMGALARLSPQRPPLRLQGLSFAQFFVWLSRSVQRVSQSIPGQSVPLDQQGLQAWASV